MKKNLFKIALGSLIIGIILLVISNFVDGKKIDLYNVNFKDFQFEKGQVYTGEVEIIGDYFYSESHTSAKRMYHSYYYNAKLKNKYDDNIYIVKVLNSGARTNMIKSGEKTFKFTGVIKDNSSKITDKQLSSLEKTINTRSANVFNISFTLTKQTVIELIGVSFMLLSAILVVVVYPVVSFMNKKVVVKN